MPKLRCAALAVSVALLPGCASFANLFGKHPGPFGGVRDSWRIVTTDHHPLAYMINPFPEAIAFLELPFDLVADLALLPVSTTLLLLSHDDWWEGAAEAVNPHEEVPPSSPPPRDVLRRPAGGPAVGVELPRFKSVSLRHVDLRVRLEGRGQGSLVLHILNDGREPVDLRASVERSRVVGDTEERVVTELIVSDLAPGARSSQGVRAGWTATPQQPVQTRLTRLIWEGHEVTLGAPPRSARPKPKPAPSKIELPHDTDIPLEAAQLTFQLRQIEAGDPAILVTNTGAAREGIKLGVLFMNTTASGDAEGFAYEVVVGELGAGEQREVVLEQGWADVISLVSLQIGKERLQLR